MTLGRKIFTFYLISYAIVSAAIFGFYLPSTTIVTITGSEVKRMAAVNPKTSINPEKAPTRDVYQISARSENGKVMMYRNEDTGWNFPWYFKFNSADIQAQSQSINQSQKLALVVSYGWRLNMFDMFKNILKIKPVADYNASTFTIYTLVTWTGWFVWLALIAIQAAIPVFWRRRQEAKEDRELGIR